MYFPFKYLPVTHRSLSYILATFEFLVTLFAASVIALYILIQIALCLFARQKVFIGHHGRSRKMPIRQGNNTFSSTQNCLYHALTLQHPPGNRVCNYPSQSHKVFIGSRWACRSEIWHVATPVPSREQTVELQGRTSRQMISRVLIQGASISSLKGEPANIKDLYTYLLIYKSPPPPLAFQK